MVMGVLAHGDGACVSARVGSTLNYKRGGGGDGLMVMVVGVLVGGDGHCMVMDVLMCGEL